MNGYALIIIFFIFMFTSCSHQPEGLTPQAKSPEIISQPSSAGPDFESTPVSDVSPPKCVNIQQSLSGLSGNGYLLWHENTPEYLLTNVTGQEIKRISKSWSISISPDLSTAAYLRPHPSPQLVILDAEGSKEFDLPNFIYSAIWINNHILRLFESFDNLDSDALFLDTMTGELTSQETDFPDFHMHPDEVNKYWSVPAFDPTLEYAIYPSYVRETEYLGNNLIRLVDREIMAQFNVDIRTPPIWSPDGESFLQPYFNEEQTIELYRIFSKNQQAVALTNFSSTYPNFLLHSYVWSPDGSKIAVWFLEDREADQHKSLVLIDLDENNHVIITCIQSLQQIGDLQDKIIWSPDSNQLIAQVKTETAPKTSYIWLDTEKMEYTLLNKPRDDSLLIAWFDFEPPTP